MPVIAAALGLGAFQIWASRQNAEMVLEQQELQGDINDMNAEFLELDAWEAEKFGFSQSARYQSVIDQTIGAQRTAFAGEGVDVSSGTARAIQEEARLTGTLNLIEIQRRARARAKGIRLKASNLRLGTELGSLAAASEASGIETAGILRAGQTGISGFERGQG